MNIKIHQNGDSNVVALCDKELIGRTLEGNGVKMKLTKQFYEGEDMEESKVIEVLKDADTINIVGEKSIEVALKAEVIGGENIRKIEGVPYAISISL